MFLRQTLLRVPGARTIATEARQFPVANIHFRSHHPRLLDLYTKFAYQAAAALGIPTSNIVPLPTKRTLWTVPRSPFVHKKIQENFERRVHKRAIKAWDAHPDVVQQWVKFLRLHALGGVAIKVTRWEHLPVGVGATRLNDVTLKLDPSVESVVEDILAAEKEHSSST